MTSSYLIPLLAVLAATALGALIAKLIGEAPDDRVFLTSLPGSKRENRILVTMRDDAEVSGWPDVMRHWRHLLHLPAIEVGLPLHGGAVADDIEREHALRVIDRWFATSDAPVEGEFWDPRAVRR